MSQLQVDPIILNAFKKESNQLIDELEEILEQIEGARGEFPAEAMKDFSQKIDRIMGASKTICMLIPPTHALLEPLRRIGKLSELCKALGYQAAEKKSVQLLPIFAGFWGDTLDVMRKILRSLDPDAPAVATDSFSAVLQGRLEWLSKRVASVNAASPSGVNVAGIDIQDLLKKIGF